jgi:uncharacterized protein
MLLYQPIMLILKTNTACNLTCRYCDADIYSRDKMSFTVLAHIIKKSLQSFKNVEFIWHGGEPLLLGQDFYRKAIWLQQNCVHDGQKISNIIQTNATLLNSEWLDFFCRNRFEIGISIDGPRILHDSYRINHNEQGSFDSVMRAVSLLKKRKKNFGVLAVVTEDTIKLGATEFLDFFVRNGLNDFSILCQRPAINIGSENYVSRSDHSRFMIEIFDLWYEMNNPDIHIRDFESIMSSLLGGSHSTCLLAGNCIGKYFAVNTNGDLYHCDEFMHDPEYKVGNIILNDFHEILSSSQLEHLKRDNENELQQLDCKWLNICNGGCPKDRYVSRLFSKDHRLQCCGFSDIIEHIQNRLSENPEIGQLLCSQS